MTTSVAPSSLPTATDRRGVAVSLAALGCGVLAARPALLAWTGPPAAVLVVLFGALLTAGIAIPLRGIDSVTRGTRDAALVFAIGAVAFGGCRLLAGGHAPARFTLMAVLANGLAAVAEEAWFRRLCYGLLAPAGTPFAVMGTTVLFAAVHVSIYGFWILPLDLTAGAIFGWQRAASGSWAVPALTHAIANLFVLV